MNTLYVTVTATADCEDLESKTFTNGLEWTLTDKDYNDDGTSVIRYEWDGEMANAVEHNLDNNRDVISYQIL